MLQAVYHLSDEQIKNLTLKEFYVKQDNLKRVVQLYNPYIGGDESSKKEAPKVATYEDLLPFIKKKKV